MSFDKGSGAEAIGQIVAQNDAGSAFALCRFGDFLLGIWALVEEGAEAAAQGGGEEGEGFA